MNGLIARARAEYEADGVLSVSTYVELNNNGVDPDALIESFEEEKL